MEPKIANQHSEVEENNTGFKDTKQVYKSAKRWFIIQWKEIYKQIHEDQWYWASDYSHYLSLLSSSSSLSYVTYHVHKNYEQGLERNEKRQTILIN